MLAAEDSVVLCDGMVELLGARGYEVVATAGTAPELLAGVAENRPDVAVVDIRMRAAHTDEGMHHRDAAEHVSQLAHEGIDEDGALRFASLLFLVDEREGARFWWQFSAGVGNATSAYCLHLYHLSRGELCDTDHWALEAATFDNPVPRTPTRHHLIHRDALRAAVRALKVDAVEESGYSRVLHPDQHLADRIEELTDAP